MRMFVRIFAALVIVVGLVWTLQGAGLLGGSFMTGRTEWFCIGIATAVVGCAGMIWLMRRRE